VILEAIRLYAARLADTTAGVNARLADAPIAAGDTRPPDVAAILTSMDDAQVARRYLDQDQATPALWVFQYQEGDLGLSIESGYFPATSIPIAIAYVDRGEDTAAMARNASTTLRAALRALNRMWTEAGGETFRQYNQISLMHHTTAVLREINAQQQDTWIGAVLVLGAELRESAI